MLQNEPLLDDRVFHAIKEFKKLSKNKRTWIVTNGELLDTFTKEEIIHSGLDKLMLRMKVFSEESYKRINKDIVDNFISLIGSRS